MKRIIGWLVAAILVSPVTVTADSQQVFPDTISLPDGWQPEGIVVGRGTSIYAGSLATGAVYRADLRTGAGSVVVPGEAGRVAVGLSYDRRADVLYVAGGPTGDAYAYDADSGATLAVFELTTATETFVNDAIVTRDAVYFTDSFRPVLYRISLLPGGRLPEMPTIDEIPLGGDFTFVPGAFNANGIEATADGRWLVVVSSATGNLYRVDPATGDATLIDLGGGSVANGDGIVLRGRTLSVVQNSFNQVAEIELDPSLSSGTIVALHQDPRFDIPTTIAAFGSDLYVVNARFSTPPTPETRYTIEKL